MLRKHHTCRILFYFFVRVIAKIMATAIAASKIRISMQQRNLLDLFCDCFAATKWVTPVSTWASELFTCKSRTCSSNSVF